VVYVLVPVVCTFRISITDISHSIRTLLILPKPRIQQISTTCRTIFRLSTLIRFRFLLSLLSKWSSKIVYSCTGDTKFWHVRNGWVVHAVKSRINHLQFYN